VSRARVKQVVDYSRACARIRATIHANGFGSLRRTTGNEVIGTPLAAAASIGIQLWERRYRNYVAVANFGGSLTEYVAGEVQIDKSNPFNLAPLRQVPSTDRAG